jgi:hypothetical protein
MAAQFAGHLTDAAQICKEFFNRRLYTDFGLIMVAGQVNAWRAIENAGKLRPKPISSWELLLIKVREIVIQFDEHN